MKRSSFITWDQLKVGALILVALIILGVGILKLGDAGNLFGKRYRLVAYVASATGMRIGGPVTVAGQLAGSIKDIRFLPVDADTTRNLELVVQLPVRDELAECPLSAVDAARDFAQVLRESDDFVDRGRCLLHHGLIVE